jgi:prepilin-type N-terminal cleavage/methylation domain-containing protein
MPARTAAAFSLLETMVVVAILAVVAAVALPNLLPVVNTHRLAGALHGTAGFVARARQEAMSRRRCVRVRVADSRTLVMELLNSYDCDAPDDTVRIDSTSPLYVELASLRHEGGLGVAFARVPAAQPTHEPAQLRFRPSGRLWTIDGTGLTPPAADAGVLAIATSGQPARGVVVESQGLICTVNTLTAGVTRC